MQETTKLITENLPIWTAVLETKTTTGRGSSKKLNLYGIKKLRELILELAVRGKLVEKDKNDEPAAKLLERISEEKAQLLKEKKIKKSKPLAIIREDEKPFELPDGWEWVRLGDIGVIFNGNSISSQQKRNVYSNVTGLPFIATKDVGYGFEDFNYKNGISIPLNKISEKKFKVAHKDSVLICCEGGSAGKKCGITKHDICFGNKLYAIEVFNEIMSKYVLSVYLTPSFYNLFHESMTGIIGGISLAKFNELLFPLPPLSEQKRIVAKVDELMAICDKLESETESNIALHQTLVETLLKTLIDSKNSKELGENWVLIADTFEALFTTEDSIDQLKQTILQLAVMGKLVPQDESDEPASVLLEKVAEEKARLIEEGKIKKQKAFISFQGLNALKKKLPKEWLWIRLGDVADIVRGGSPRPAGDPRFYDGDIPFLKVADITKNNGKYVEGYNATIKKAGINKTRYIETRTVLLSNSGATLGIPAICEFPTTFNDGIAAFVEQSEYVYDEYLFLYLKSLSIWFLDIASRGQGQPNLNTDIIKATWFALPPLAEQHRIVAKVDNLSVLCEQLKKRITDSKTTQKHFADAVLESITGKTTSESVKMKVPKTELITKLQLVKKPKVKDNAPLSTILAQNSDELSAKMLWSKSSLPIDEFYRQLKVEMQSGWIVEPQKAEVLIVEEKDN